MNNARPRSKAKSSAPSRREFTGTSNPRYLRVIAVLLRRPISRNELDDIAGCANGPDAVTQIRNLFTDGKGKEHLPCERIKFLDRDGKPCRPGVYSFSMTGRRRVYAWLTKQARG
jgi:hypothetical protein